MALPWSEWTGIPALAPISERFTSPVSVVFVTAANEYVNVTRTNATTQAIIASRLYILTLGTGTITLEGKGTLSVDNPLTITTDWIVPKSLEANLSHANLVFHADFSMFSPQRTNFLGIPENADLNLTRVGPKYFPNGTEWGTEWTTGPRTVVFVESGPLQSELRFNNATLTGPDGKPTQVDLDGIMPNVIEIGSEEATSSSRNNDWTITLTFALLFFVVVDLGSEQSGEDTQDGETKEGQNNNGPQNGSAKVDSYPNRNGQHGDKADDSPLLNRIEPTSEAPKAGFVSSHLEQLPSFGRW